MKLLKVKANGFKNCIDGLEIDLIAKSRKYAEDKEYELVEVAEDLHVFSTAAFVGKNASGKTTALDLLDCCYSILGDYRLEDKHYDYDGIHLEIFFYHDGDVYKYITDLKSDSSLGNKATFDNQHIYCKKYFKTNLNSIYADEGYSELEDLGALPEDTAIVFFVLGKKATRALYYDSFGNGLETYQMVFKAMKNYNISRDIFLKIVKLFDNNVKNIESVDDRNFKLTYGTDVKLLSDSELIYFLSSGTTKGILLYVLMVASLKNGFDLLVDEIENHFHKTLVENMISLYKDKTVNKHNATLVFTTHYCEVLDLFNRRDNIWLSKQEDKVYLENMYGDYKVRTELLKSKQFYSNTFKTAVNYDDLMKLKKELMQ